MRKNNSHGFALPLIMLVSLSLMIVSLTMLQASSSLRTGIDDQYYNRLADEAAQSGVTYAVDCLAVNGYTQTWTAPLTPGQDCDSTPANPALSNLSAQTDTSGTFSVGNIEGRSDGAVLVTSVGTVNRYVNGTNTIAKTYTSTVKRVASSAYVKFNGVTFGYYFYNITNNGPNNPGVYYFVKGSDGQLRAAGSNDYGQLGNGSQTNVLSPQVVNIPDGKKAANVYTNFLSQGWNAFIKTTDGTIYGAGLGDRGQLGNGTTTQYNPTLQKFILPPGENGTYVGLLGYATFVLTDQNNLYSAGQCDAGELGYDCGGASNKSTPARVQLPTPDPSDPNTIPEQDFIADSYTAFIRMKGGRVYGWGGNNEGQLGDGTNNDSSTPKQIGIFGDTGKPKATAIAFDGISLYVLDDTGSVWTTGNNSWGQLGLGSGVTRINTLMKIPVPAAAGRVVQMSTDQWFVTLRTSTGAVYGAGYNGSGQLGNGTTAYRQNSLVKFILPSGVRATNIYNSSIGDLYDGSLDNTFVVGNNGKVYGAGGNAAGQLGNGTTSSASTPVAMNVFDGRKVRARSVTYGYGTTVILSNKNTYYTVGNNQYGQLGNGTTNSTTVPAEAKFLQPASGSFVF